MKESNVFVLADVVTVKSVAVLNIFSYDHSKAIRERIRKEGEFTIAVENDPISVLPIALGLLCLPEEQTIEEEITHLCVLHKGTLVATRQIRIRSGDILFLPFPISKKDFLKYIPVKWRASVKATFSIGYKSADEATGQIILEALLKIYPDYTEAISLMAKSLDPWSEMNGLTNIDDRAAEKDAVSIAVEIFGMNHNQALQVWKPTNEGLAESFLEGIKSRVAYEDEILSNDLHTVPGWQMVKRELSGIVDFKNSSGEKLTVINANRNPLEKALGVDLIYFHRQYEAFTFVQYKMMDRGVGESVAYFNPSTVSHKEELERMRELFKGTQKHSANGLLGDYRLANCPIFFKLCRKIQMNFHETAIVPGAYISLDQWELLLKDVSTKGPKGGTQIGHHTLNKRYVGTGTFIELVQRGLVGTYSASSNEIASFIRDVIERGHSVIYAVDNSKGKKKN